jgi:hypothetical protein
MTKHFIAALIVAASAAAAAPVFASGYGPAPHYDPIAGAPWSQRGQSVQTIRADQAAAVAAASADTRSFGGVRESTSQAGRRSLTSEIQSNYSHH